MNRVHPAHQMTLLELDTAIRGYFSLGTVEGASEKAVDCFYDNFREKECSICLESFTKSDYRHSIETRCHHLFHSQCLRDWSKHNVTAQTCPNCKKDMRFKTDYRLWRILRKALKLHFPECVDSDEKIARRLQEQYNKEAGFSLNVDKQNPAGDTKIRCGGEDVGQCKDNRS